MTLTDMLTLASFTLAVFSAGVAVGMFFSNKKSDRH